MSAMSGSDRDGMSGCLMWRFDIGESQEPIYEPATELVDAATFREALDLLGEAADLVDGGCHERRIDEFLRRHGVEREAEALASQQTQLAQEGEHD